ncbi:MAG: 4Fe-4S ferredoxin, partial [Bacteroidetes bacterium]|nr:4Fe-4S ferredoxin [Bacteroidota bacterium]
MENNPSISISNPPPPGTDIIQKTGLILFSIGVLLFIIAAIGVGSENPITFFSLSIGLSVGGALIYFFKKYLKEPAGVKNNRVWQNSLTSRGIFGWMFGIILTGFYIILYWFPSMLENLIHLMDPLSYLIRGKSSDRWFLYGTLYTLAIVVMGIKAILKYRHSNYQIIRTSSIIFFQLGFAYLIPAVLQLFNQPEFYFSYFWPLKYDYLFPSTVSYLTEHPGALGVFMVFWG